jgi:hypothetical protein|tara:strand:- start:15421 stop:16071 length:651 start_codon:yes stop_codon:yes gene_type:complete
MSLSQEYIKPADTNPISAYARWKGAKGLWEIYSKDTGQTVLTQKLDFVILDQLNSVRGFTRSKGLYSCAEVKDIHAQPMSVYLTENGKSTLFKEGLYSEIKADLKEKGIKFQKVVYAMANDNHEDSTLNNGIIKLELQGAAMSAWFETGAWEGHRIEMGEATHQDGAISYYIPKFIRSKATDNMLEKAKGKDVALQEYLKKFRDNKEEESQEEIPF